MTATSRAHVSAPTRQKKWLVTGLAGFAVAVSASGFGPGAQHRVQAAGDQRARVQSDFNSDGYSDVAIGAPNADGGRGTVTVLYGSSGGLASAVSQSWTLSAAQVGVAPSLGDQFGFAVAAGDFNGDGFGDLAVGVPGKNAVVVLYGSSHGLDAQGAQYLRVSGPHGGFALASGNFNSDRFSDLAVGEPFAMAAHVPAGGVDVLYGSARGFTTTTRGSAQHFSETSVGIPGLSPGTSDTFGLALTSGDFNGDGYADLAIGIPNRNGDLGGVVVLYGSPRGVSAYDSQFLPTWGQSGGFALAAGDFNHDGFDDLAIGEPGTFDAAGSGTVEIHYGGAAGLMHLGFGTAQLFAQTTLGMPGPQAVEDDSFGFSLATGDLNGDGFADLAVGVPGQSGAMILYGSGHGLTVRRAQFVPGIGPRAGSMFSVRGVSVAAADVAQSGFADLFIGEPFTDTTQPQAGVVEVHRGSPGGVSDVTLGTALALSEDTPGMAGGPASPDDLFGLSIAAARGA